MTALAGAFLYLYLHLGPNGWLLYDQLARRDAMDRHLLPIGALYEISREPLYLVFHQQKGWQKAFYLPESSAALPAERNLPGLKVPRLYLYQPYYLKSGQLPDFKELPVDIASAYYQALLELQFDRRLGKGAFAKQANDRADQLFAEVPAGQRLEVYGATLAEFAAHLMSIAGELARAKRRGTNICPREAPIPLLEQWRRAFESGVFVGSYSVEGSWDTVLTREALSREDKDLAVKELLGRFRFRGEPVADLAPCKL